MRIIITGGGTGGHIYPALAIAQGLINRDPEIKILYVGTKDGMEASLVPKVGWEFAGVSGQGLPRKLSLGMLKTAAMSLKALWETKEILKRFHPDLVVGTGGYVSGPVVLTAALFGIPTLLHEQNAMPGITNRILAHLVKGIMVTFPESRERLGVKLKVRMTGLPVRPDIGTIGREEAAKHFGFDPEKRTLLVTGGSRGARSLNQAMVKTVEKLQEHPEVQLIWATGNLTYAETMAELKEKGIYPEKHPQWRILEYLQDMPQALGCADLFIGRAGAATLAEIMVVGKPAILIPYPYAAENHQEYNARSLVESGAATIILDRDLNGDILWQEIEHLLTSPAILAKMAKTSFSLAQPEALNKIVNNCLETAWK